MPTRRGATRRDLPAICLFYGVYIWFFALLLLPNDHRLANGSEIQSVSGTVERVFHEHGKSGNYFNLVVRASDGHHHFTEEGLLSRTIPEMARFVPGDLVTAQAKHDARKNLDWCWALARNGHIILTYDQTERYLQETAARHKRVSHITDVVTLVLSASLLTCAFLLRRHFGGWFDKPSNESIEH